MTFGYTFSAVKGEFAEAMADLQTPMAEAASAAIDEAAVDIKTQGRASIASAGFSKRWQNGWRVLTFPRGKTSVDAAAFAFHRIHYATVFEEGATIRGKPTLWLPISTPGKRVPRSRRTPERFTREIGPLAFVARLGKPPLLVAPAMLGPGQANKRNPEPSVRALRRGAAGSPGTRGQRTVLRSVPLFVGLDRVRIGKKFDVLGGIDRVAARLTTLYLKHLKAG